MMKAPALIAIAATLLAAGVAYANWTLPDLPPPEEYGNVTISRNTADSKEVKPVVFSHLAHRSRYTCRVCHFELEFALRSNATDIREADNRNGLYCGACHNGSTAFGHTKDNCGRCHAGKPTFSKKDYKALASKMPESKYGDKIDWVLALRRLHLPYSIFKNDERPFRFNSVITLMPEWLYIKPAIFPHSPHVRLLDCANCHPQIFNIHKKTTKHFEMVFILEKRFCGICHLGIAFPLNDCQRCHPGMEDVR